MSVPIANHADGVLYFFLAGFDPRNLDTVWQREITPVMLGLAPERFAEPGKTASRNYVVVA